MADSLQDLQAQLVLVNQAITDVLGGKKVLEFQIGTGPTMRRYKFADITLDNLKSEKNRILHEIETMGATSPTFRTFSRMQVAHRKM